MANTSFSLSTEWQWPLSDVYSIVMEKLAQAVEGGGGVERLPLFTISTITYKVVVYAQRADTLLLFLLYPYMYSVSLSRLKHKA